jgi:hypothetical protein
MEEDDKLAIGKQRPPGPLLSLPKSCFLEACFFTLFLLFVYMFLSNTVLDFSIFNIITLTSFYEKLRFGSLAVLSTSVTHTVCKWAHIQTYFPSLCSPAPQTVFCIDWTFSPCSFMSPSRLHYHGCMNIACS